MDTLLASSFGTVLMGLCQGLLTAPSQPSLTLFAGGWALATGRQTITTSLWLTGAAAVQPCSRFAVFLGGPCSQARGRIWACSIRHAAPLAPADAAMSMEVDATTKHKAGPHLEGGDRDRHAAGSARQEYRPLWGVHVVLAVRRIPVRRWPGQAVTIPIGLARYRPEAPAPQRQLP